MKKIAAALLCLCLIAAFPLTAFAQNTAGGDTHISTVVPGFHKITVISDRAEVSVNGTVAAEFTVERLSEPTAVFKPDIGYRIISVLLNGEDITDKITDGSYTLEPVYEDKIIIVTTEGVVEPPTTEPTTENPSTTEPTTEPKTENPSTTEPDSTEPTSNPQSGSQGTNPVQTGQAVHIALWIVFMISLAAIIVLSRRHSRKEITDK